MKKLRLELDDLAVESFETSRGGSGVPGTVHGHKRALPLTLYEWECGTLQTYEKYGCNLYTANAGDATCQAVYTCPECASPPQTMDFCVETVDICVAPVA